MVNITEKIKEIEEEMKRTQSTTEQHPDFMLKLTI